MLALAYLTFICDLIGFETLCPGCNMKTVEMHEKREQRVKKCGGGGCDEIKKKLLVWADRKQTFIKPKIQQEREECIHNMLASFKVNEFS